MCSLRSIFSGLKEKLEKHFPFKSNCVSSVGNVDGDLQPGLNGGVQKRLKKITINTRCREVKFAAHDV